MTNEGNDAGDSRPSAPRRVTLQGRTFGKIAMGTPIRSSEGIVIPRESGSSEARTSGPQRVTGPRHSTS